MQDIFLWIFGWPIRCILQATVGILYPTRSPLIRRLQFVTLGLLLTGIAETIGGCVVFSVSENSWKFGLATFAAGWVTLAIAGSVAYFIEVVVLDSAKDTSAKSSSSAKVRADSSQIYEVQPLP